MPAQADVRMGQELLAGEAVAGPGAGWEVAQAGPGLVAPGHFAVSALDWGWAEQFPAGAIAAMPGRLRGLAKPTWP